MTKIANIIDGYRNYFTGDKPSDKTAARAAICASCPHAKKLKLLALAPDMQFKNIRGYYCQVCKCPLSVKVRSQNETCPVNRW